jgi:hypothetical protein
MTWAKLDDRLWADPRTDAAGLEAMGLWAVALSWMGAYNTNGVIPRACVAKLAGRKAHWLADRQVAGGRMERAEVVAAAPGLGNDPDLQVGAEAVIAHALLRHLDRQRRIEGGHLDRQRRIEGGQGRAQLVDRCSVRAVELLALGALRGGVRFVAAYPITPATELLEWMSPALPKSCATTSS